MSPEDSYKKIKKAIGAIDPITFVKPNETPAEILSDGNSQLAVAKIDEPTLVEEGMPVTLISETEEALMGYIWVKTLADTAVSQATGDELKWEHTRQLGYAVRKNLFKYGKQGCEINNLPEIRKALNKVIANNGDDDMILDLLESHQLFTAHPEMTNGLPKFNPIWVLDALNLHNTLKQLQAAVKNPVLAATSEKLALESRAAFTIYYQKMKELRGWGRFTFEGEPRADSYKAEYMVERAEVARQNKKKSAK